MDKVFTYPRTKFSPIPLHSHYASTFFRFRKQIYNCKDKNITYRIQKYHLFWTNLSLDFCEPGFFGLLYKDFSSFSVFLFSDKVLTCYGQSSHLSRTTLPPIMDNLITHHGQSYHLSWTTHSPERDNVFTCVVKFPLFIKRFFRP